MSADRIVYSMVLGWVVLTVALIALDWLGNPNRGSFRPKGDRALRDRSLRKADRTRRRLESDAAVRATLRDAYGASSMRLSWSGEQESDARVLDDALVVHDLQERVGVVDVGSRELPNIDYTTIDGDPLPNPDEEPPAETLDADTDPDGTEAEREGEPVPEEAIDRPVGWKVGVDPLALTAKGTEPSAQTIRTRVWKNLATTGGWDADNADRLRAGRPPSRVNPITGAVERARVDVATGTASWGDEPIDPFAQTT